MDDDIKCKSKCNSKCKSYPFSDLRRKIRRICLPAAFQPRLNGRSNGLQLSAVSGSHGVAAGSPGLPAKSPESPSGARSPHNRPLIPPASRWPQKARKKPEDQAAVALSPGDVKVSFKRTLQIPLGCNIFVRLCNISFCTPNRPISPLTLTLTPLYTLPTPLHL